MIIAIGMLSAVCASDLADNITSAGYETPTAIDEDTPLESSKPGTFSELQSQINNAEKGSTIYLTKDYTYNKNFTGKNGITITKTITIDGNGHSIDGLEKSQLLLINKADNVVLKNIVFKNGYNKNAGIVSVINSNHVKFNKCSFNENNAGTGVVYLDNTNYTSVTNCEFLENSVEYTGGAIYMAHNRFTSFLKCDFDANTADLTGGAIYSNENYITSFKTCSFIANGADDGGAIFSSNDDSTTFIRCDFIDDTAFYCGGAIYLINSNNPSFELCNFEDNSAQLIAGGAVYLAGNNNSFFDSCDFYRNYAENAGAVYATNNKDIIFDFCNFYDNEGTELGGAVLANNTNIYLNFCDFDSNRGSNGSCIFAKKSNIHSTASSFMNAEGGDIGGAINALSSALDFSNCRFSDNYAETAGGDIYTQNSMIFLENTTFSNSRCSWFGGSLSFNDDYVQIKNCTFTDCTSEMDGGGAIYCLNSVVYIQSTEYYNSYSAFGGAICSLNSDLEIEKNWFYANTAWYSGGAIYSIYGSVAVNNSVFIYSKSQDGGAIYIRSPQKINITNNYFIHSSAKKGPRIYIDEYYGKIAESGNIYEDVYFAVGHFNGTDDNDTDYGDYSNVITYVVSNSNDYLSNFSYYTDLGDLFASMMGFTAKSGNFNIHDEAYPNDSVILLNYNDYENRTIIYDCSHPPAEMDFRELTVSIYNYDGFEYTNLDVLAVIANTTYADGTSSEYNYIYSTIDHKQVSGWWALPIFEDETRAIINEDKDGVGFWHYPVNSSEFTFDCIKGKFYFNFEDRKLDSNFGNAYEFKSRLSEVPLINFTSNITDLPSYYDSRDYHYITIAKDQGIGKNCWAFAGIATLEACLAKATGQIYDFSENNAKNIMAASSIYGLNIDSNAGGYDTMFIGYLASWLGPVHETYDIYNPISSMSTDMPSVYHIQDIAFIPARDNSSDNDKLKSAIINCGAVCVILDWTVDNVSQGYHTVALIGWDDEYKGLDILGNPSQGAWIFKNSWGELWGENGFGYLSYEQKLSQEIAPYMHAYTFIFNEADIGYQDLYQYDFSGLSDFLNVDANEIYYKNRFIAKDNEFLSAFSTYFEKPTYFTYAITINGKEAATSEKIYSPAGYHTIRLDEYLSLNKSDEFEIIIKLIDANIPVCQADELYKLTYPSNVSFFSYNGKDWIDMYDLNSQYNFAYSGFKTNTSQVACIKAFTTVCRMDYTPAASFIISPGGSLLNPYFSVYNLDVYSVSELPLNKTVYILMTIPEWDQDEQYEHLVEIKINNETYYSKIQRAMSSLEIKFDKEGNYTFSAKLKSNYYSSNTTEFNFIVSANVTEYELSSTFTELNAMISNSADGYIITLDKDCHYDDNFIEHYIIIDHSITIDGNGHTLNGLLKSSILGIDYDCNVTLRNINFKGGNLTAIYSFGNLNIYNCSFTDNVGEYGGAIYSKGYLSIHNCIFKNNTVNMTGGAIDSNGDCIIENSIFDSNTAGFAGGAICSLETMDIINCTFKNNHVTDEIQAGGGAIHSENETYIENSIFESNSADDGGAISALEDIRIYNCNFKNNYANVSGGALELVSVYSITESTFKNNTAKYGGAIDTIAKGYISDSTFQENTAENGGAIYCEQDINVERCNFNSNNAINGGAIEIDSRSFLDPEDDAYTAFNFITDSIFNNNSANFGGAILSCEDITITSCTFKNNHANKSGGATYSQYECIITDSTFNNNSADFGGAAYGERYVDISKCTFKNNLANEDGGAVYAPEGFCITDSIFESNEAQYGAAALSFEEINVKNCNFKNNNANESGGAIYSAKDCTVENSKFSSNRARHGGAIYTEETSHAKITSSEFIYNSAKDNGGTIYSQNMLEITDSIFKSNQNMEIIFSNNTNNISNSLYLKNNKMEMSNKNAAAIWYISTVKDSSPLYLVFSNVNAVKGNTVSVAQIKNADGNTFKISDLNVRLTKQGKTTSHKIIYNDTLGGYLFDTSSLDYGAYKLTGSLDDETTNCIVKDGTLNIVKKSVIKASALTKTYGTSKKLTITLQNDKGNAIANAYVNVKINGKTTKLKTNSKGQVYVAVNLIPKTYTATITYGGNSQYSTATKQIKITIKKATPKLTANKKTFKTKTKKYTVTLKNNMGKAMKNTKVTLKINGKTYTAKTNSKGQATFNLKITKKGTFKATVKYGGNKYYNSVTKTATIIVKK
ncbi:right-handed parallel beta-helix repeat-containing protein [uncultured Methanobrevibacter sp.]|uniref:right-handed parallel beta-helix repeat-containing protein n=1 Tax=uncultured Methanobrevibacter sp. TaxID=253161 RepID=UPI00260FEAFC|nr:right-handed parallel beta-helix repeat-containing protein [uncultured Methanobrevibacter sp.]